MMESAIVRTLAILGFLSVAVVIALAFGRYIFAALDTAIAKWRRLGFAARVVSAAMIVIATVEAQKGGGRSGGVESGGVKAFQLTHPPTPNSPTVPLFTLSSVVTNDYFSYSMPSNAVRYPNWWMRGAYEDVFRLDFGDWSFPLGTASVSSLWVYTWGKARSRLRGGYEVSAVGSPMSAVPQVSEFWHASGTNGSKILTWYNFFLGRIPATSNIPTFEHSNIPTLISAQLELFPNGDFIARSNLVERSYKRVNPDDWDDDGIPNDIDEDPLTHGGDNFGPLEELPDGADSNNYCWVEVIVSNANSLVTFTGDGVSDLPDPNFIARAGETNRVNLLIGKTYRVASAQPIFCTAKSSEEIEVSGESPRAMTVVWPVSYEITENARSASRQVRMIPPQLSGTIQWNTNTCCEQVQNSPSELPRCSPDCTCGGCTLGGFTFNYEGYSLYFDGIDCGCTYGESGEDEYPESASVDVSFSHAVLFYEEAYTNAPGDTVARRHSTNVTVTCTASGGPHGGLLNLARTGFDRLTFAGGDDLPDGNVMLAPGETRTWTARYAPLVHSDEKDDVALTARLDQYETGETSSDEDRLTVVKLELTPEIERTGCENRHVIGIRETVNCSAMPDIGRWMNTSGGEISENSVYRAPLVSDGDELYHVVDGDSYKVGLTIIEPSVVVARDPKVRDSGLAANMAGGIGMELQIYILPETVSFAGIAMEEIPSTEGDHTGYFSNLFFADIWYHTYAMGAGNWINLKPDNFWDVDQASMGDRLPLEKPNGDITWNLAEGSWNGGTNVWHIQWGWQDRNAEQGDLPIRSLPTSYNQTFVIDPQGTLSIAKFDHTVSRGTNGVIRLNGIIIE